MTTKERETIDTVPQQELQLQLLITLVEIIEEVNAIITDTTFHFYVVMIFFVLTTIFSVCLSETNIII